MSNETMGSPLIFFIIPERKHSRATFNYFHIFSRSSTKKLTIKKK